MIRSGLITMIREKSDQGKSPYAISKVNITVLQNHLSGVVRASIPVARATSFYAAKATLYGVILFGIILEATANNKYCFRLL